MEHLKKYRQKGIKNTKSGLVYRTIKRNKADLYALKGNKFQDTFLRKINVQNNVIDTAIRMNFFSFFSIITRTVDTHDHILANKGVHVYKTDC
jgi:hypothetical protein